MNILGVLEVQSYINNYYIKDGAVYSKENVLQSDENIILKAKASRLIYNEAVTKYQSDLKQFGKVSKTNEQYIETELKKHGLTGEINDWPQNKTINNILNCNGDYEEKYMGDTLNSERYGLFSGVKKDYGLALLRLKARTMGKDVYDVDISIDTTDFIKTGHSIVSVIAKITPYKKSKEEIHKERMKEVSLLKAKRNAIYSLKGIVSDAELKDFYDKLDKENDYDKVVQIISEINDIVKKDYKNKITDINNYTYGEPYRFLCQSIGIHVSNWDETIGYHGNYISCSLVTNEQNDTYSGDIGFIYDAENVVAAGSNDINLENRANNDLDVMRLQSIPTISNVDQMIQDTIKRKQENNNENTYNEVGIRKAQPVAIFCKTDDINSEIYKQAQRIQSKYPNLKIIILPKKTFVKSTETKNNSVADFEYEQSDILRDLENKKQQAIKDNDEVAVNYYTNSIKTELKNNPIAVTTEKWDTMEEIEKRRFIELKMKEAKILDDKDAFEYWNAIREQLANKTNKEEHTIRTR